IFFISTQAETGRAPFDLLEAESELVAGFNIEYSGMKFGLFMAGEFVHVFTNALLMAALFFGGWVGPGVDQIPALGFVYVTLKASIFYLFSLLLRSTLPRVRIDQLMSFNWKFLVPVSSVNVIVVAFLLQVVRALGLAPATDLANDFIANLPQASVLLLGSLVIVAFVLQQLRNFGRQERASAQTVTVRKEDDVDMLPAQAAH
ncbi:MAG: NADH-quinone oxidoreductase subunit H, partial [Anaerolineae bacterium]|nr:NADH-quinone oxidoreductase subunit H [Anaerolineae bacterium]